MSTWLRLSESSTASRGSLCHTDIPCVSSGNVQRQRCSPGRRDRQRCRVSNTLVGPDPRLATRVAERSTLPPSQLLKGREVEESAMWRCIELQQKWPVGVTLPGPKWADGILNEAYERCGAVTSEYAKTFYLGTQLMTPKQARAIWAIYVWCRRTDELVDGPNASRITPQVCSALQLPPL
eukprot:jgi/Chrzof1/11331/Cz05g32220.t1_PSY[v5.2]